MSLRVVLAAAEADVEVVAECGDGASAVATIEGEAPDLVFLDVQMPELDGFGVLEALGSAAPAVVFVTAYDAYAIRAFEVHALDYLLKPFDGDRFREALGHARKALRAGGVDRRVAALLEDLAGRRTLDRVVVKSGGRVVFLDVDDIEWIAAAGNYVELHVGDRIHLVRDTLKAFTAKLDPKRFVRIHRSHVVNLDRVRELQPWFHGEWVVVLEDGTELRTSRTYSDRLERLLENRP